MLHEKVYEHEDEREGHENEVGHAHPEEAATKDMRTTLEKFPVDFVLLVEHWIQDAKLQVPLCTRE